MYEKPKCDRCGQVAETHDWESNSTFWGWLGLGTATIRRKLVRVKSQWYRRNPQYGSPLLLSDDLLPLCDTCWSDLVSLFLQGRTVPSVTKKEQR